MIDEEKEEFNVSFTHTIQGFPERFTVDDIKDNKELELVIASIIRELVISSIEAKLEQK